MITCSKCNVDKEKEEFPQKGRVCKKCKNERNTELFHEKKAYSKQEMLNLICAVDLAYRKNRKIDTHCACKDIVKFCDKYKIHRSDSVGR